MFYIILLLIIFLLFIYPVLKAWMAIRKARRQFNDMFGAQAGPRRQRQQAPRQRRRTKIITHDVGEYVEYEDLPGQYEYTGATYTHTETQVEDADWEEIR